MSHHNDSLTSILHRVRVSFPWPHFFRKIGSNDFGLGWQAFRNGKTTGTLAWVFHVQSTSILSRPLNQLLHYPVPEKAHRNFFTTCTYLLAIRYLSQCIGYDTKCNDLTGNHGNELYRRSPGVPQETHYLHGCHIHPKYDREKYSSHSCFVRALSLFSFPSPSFSHSFPSSLPSLLSSLFPIANPFHSSASHEQKQQSPLLVHSNSQSYLARRLARPMAQPHIWSGRVHCFSPWCGFQHAPWREGCGCGTGDRGRGEGDGGR